jgi:hypothetical protein
MWSGAPAAHDVSRMGQIQEIRQTTRIDDDLVWGHNNLKKISCERFTDKEACPL